MKKLYIYAAAAAVWLSACSPKVSTPMASTTSQAANPAAAAPEPKRQLTNADYERAVSFMGQNLRKLVHHVVEGGAWDGSRFAYMKRTPAGNRYIVADPTAKSVAPLFDEATLAAALGQLLSTTINANELTISGMRNVEAGKMQFTYRGKRYIFDATTKQVTAGAASKLKADEVVSPNGKLAVYRENSNLWVRNLETNEKQQLTFDGAENYGYGTDNAGWQKSNRPVVLWSPNSDKIATFQQDSRGMGEMYLTSTNVGHPRLERWKYEMPGDEKVFMIERVIVHLGASPKVVRLKQEADYQRSTITDHIAGPNSELLDAQFNADGSKLAYVTSSRDHKKVELKVANTQTGDIDSILKEETPTFFESGVNIISWSVRWDSHEVIWYSPRTDWGHLYLYDLRTKQLKNAITTGEWAVQYVAHVDDKNRRIYLVGQGREIGNPYYEYLYSVNFEGTDFKLLTPEKGTHRIQPNADWSKFVDTYSTPSQPPVTVLRDANGSMIMELSKGDESALKATGYKAPVEITTKARDGKTDLYGLLFLPTNYDPWKSYPIVNYIYPGPQVGSVSDYSYAPGSRDHQAMAELGFAVFALDGMGSTGRSKKFMDAYYGNMGDNGLPDQIAGIKQVAGQFKGLDLSRVGIWGRSGGGFASADGILRYPDFYKVAFSIAGNHDNRNYEADWGEKFHGLYVKNPDGTSNYDDQANQNMAKNLRGKLMIVHGGMDDNVPPYMSYLLIDALINANKDFDMLIFPNQTHRFGDQQNYLTRRMWDYFVENLMGATPPREFLIK